MAVLWRKEHPDSESQDYWDIREKYVSRITERDRIKIFIYKPFDNGFVRFHEELHFAITDNSESEFELESRIQND